MRFNGQWLQCDDGIVRPIIRAEVLSGDGAWRGLELLVDTGADRTVFSANVLETLDQRATVLGSRIGGVGGLAESVNVSTELRLTRQDGEKTIFRGQYVACTDHEALDMSVLGRDILDMFALVVDRKADVIAMIGGQHHYTIAGR